MDNPPDDLIRIAKLSEFQEWLKHPQTRRFIDWLENKAIEHHNNLVDTCERISDAETKQQLIVEKHLKEILTYAKNPA